MMAAIESEGMVVGVVVVVMMMEGLLLGCPKRSAGGFRLRLPGIGPPGTRHRDSLA